MLLSLYLTGVIISFFLHLYEYVTSQENIKYDTTEVCLATAFCFVGSFLSWYYIIVFLLTREQIRFGLYMFINRFNFL